jgi:hypothetical protein
MTLDSYPLWLHKSLAIACHQKVPLEDLVSRGGQPVTVNTQGERIETKHNMQLSRNLSFKKAECSKII